MNKPSYKHTVLGINYCLYDCYTYDNTLTINLAGSECITKATCVATNALSNDFKNCVTACPTGKKQ